MLFMEARPIAEMLRRIEQMKRLWRSGTNGPTGAGSGAATALVSAAIPFSNQERFPEDAIQSILAQTFFAIADEEHIRIHFDLGASTWIEFAGVRLCRENEARLEQRNSFTTSAAR
jgi:hypothetical protein